MKEETRTKILTARRRLSGERMSGLSLSLCDVRQIAFLLMSLSLPACLPVIPACLPTFLAAPALPLFSNLLVAVHSLLAFFTQQYPFSLIGGCVEVVG